MVVATSQFADPLEREPVMLNGGKTMLVQVGRRGKYVGAVGFFADDAQKIRFYLVTLDSTNYNGPATPMKKVIEDEYRNMLKGAGVVENFPRHDYTGGTAGATYVGAETCKPMPPQHLQEMVHDQARPGLRRSGEGPQAQCHLRCRMRDLPHNGFRVHFGMAVRGRDAPSKGHPVRELPRAGVRSTSRTRTTASFASRLS